MSGPPLTTLSSMQSEWLTEDWKPSALPDSNWVKPDFEDAVDQVYNVMNRTTDLLERPYHPGHWLVRARALHINGYPELAVGDAHKALLICDAEASGDVELAEKVKSSKGMKLKRHQRKPWTEVAKVDGAFVIRRASPLFQQDSVIMWSFSSKSNGDVRFTAFTANERDITGAKEQPLDPIAAPIEAIRQEACYIMVLALQTCKSYHEALETCRDAMQMYPFDRRFSDLAETLRPSCEKEGSNQGGFIAIQYPWLSYEHKKRQRTTLASAIAHISGISQGALTLQESKTIAGSSPKPIKSTSRRVKWLDHDQTKTLMVDGTAVARPQLPPKDFSKKEKLPTKVKVPDSDILGVFATRDIPKDTLLLTDTTITGAASTRTRNMCGNCYALLPRHRYTTPGSSITWCSPLCRDLALASYHRPIHDKLPDGTLDWVQQAASASTSTTLTTSTNSTASTSQNQTTQPPPPHSHLNLLLLRFLASALNENTHPLCHETSAILSGRHDGAHIERFTREDSIAVPCRMLRDLGVDVFADGRFETWVLLMLRHRICVNVRVEDVQGGGTQTGWITAVNPCYSMFNHSCLPNARALNTGTTTVKVVALRDIAKGEEVFLDYRAAAAGDRRYTGGREERSLDDKDLLRELLGAGGCRCGRCGGEG